MKVLPGAGVVKDRKTISDFTDLDVDDQGGFPVNSADCMVLDQSINNTWKNLKYGGLNAKLFQRRKPSRKTNGGFVNDVYSSWEEMKTEHIRNAIDTQRGVMTQIIEKQGVQLRFSLRMLPNSMSFCSEFINVEIFQQKTFFCIVQKKVF